jgi:hypothetical protein
MVGILKIQVGRLWVFSRIFCLIWLLKGFLCGALGALRLNSMKINGQNHHVKDKREGQRKTKRRTIRNNQKKREL